MKRPKYILIMAAIEALATFLLCTGILRREDSSDLLKVLAGYVLGSFVWRMVYIFRECYQETKRLNEWQKIIDENKKVEL